MKDIYTVLLGSLCVIFCVTPENTDSFNVSPEGVQPLPPVNGVRIAWDYTTRKQLSPASANYSGYARMIRLRDGSLFCVYESDGSIHAIHSNDDAASWSDHQIIAGPENGISCAVPEVLQLQNDAILISYNMRPPANNADETKRFSIRVTQSKDAGTAWSSPKEIYKAGHEFRNGCWEPAQIQIPSGEIQLFIANEGPYTQSNEQEITMFSSSDNGETWSEGRQVSFRANHRDGMPVPLVLQNGDILMAIEDNGIDPPEFKPAIIRTSISQNWDNAPVSGSSRDRLYVLRRDHKIPPPKYAGAPYIRQLISGEVILSYQGNERRTGNAWDRSDMIVCIGDERGMNFTRKSVPFYFNNESKSCLWNSLTVLDDHTVIALGSTNAYGNKTAVWMIKGYILPEIHSQKATITVDGDDHESIWRSDMPVFIGGYGKTRLTLNSFWDNNNFYFIGKVTDDQVQYSANDVTGDDAVEISIDPANISSSAPVKGIYAMAITPGGTVSLNEGENGLWKESKIKNVTAQVKLIDDGYRFEVKIPWTSLGGLPALNKRIGFNATIFESTTGRKHDYQESINGNYNNAPYSWSPLYLIE